MTLRDFMIPMLLCLGGCALLTPHHDAYQDAVNRDVAAGQAACKRDPTLAMCNPGQGSVGKFALANEGCDGSPSYMMNDGRGYQTGGIGGIQSDVFVDAWPATICLTSSSDPNACGSNKVQITGPGLKVVATSCSQLQVVKDE